MNTTIVTYAIIGQVGIVFGWFLANYKNAKKRAKQLLEREEIITKLFEAKQQISLSAHWKNECTILNNELRDLRSINTSLEADLREATTKLESIQLYTEEKIRQITSGEHRINEQFENLANRIFEKSNRQIDEQNKKSLSNLLTPLREQLDGFRKQVQESFGQEARERYSLAHEIHNLQQLNEKMVQEAVNLTRALKGNNKTQGNWGEIVLSHVLEASGLRNGHEYETQVNFATEKHSRMQPDVIVHMPHDKHVIIDSKMTLVAYERYFNATEECAKELALQDHISSIRTHIRLLRNKDYQQLGIHTLDYVLMFIPVEPAFLLALEKQPSLLTEAVKSNIMLVSPSTLLVALRTIANLWRYEHQSRNTQKISERASKLYDKIRLFVDDMLLVGQNLDRAQDSYRQAMKKLTSGRGNLLAQTESFRLLGVEVKREINSELVEEAVIQDKESQVCCKK